MPTCCASRRKACQGFSLGRNQGFRVSTELALVPASTQYFLERTFRMLRAPQGTAQSIFREPKSDAVRNSRLPSDWFDKEFSKYSLDPNRISL
jgi:hypothetical protein